MKQALVDLSKQSLADQESQETFQSVYAMLFFGVPCKGLDGERLGLAAMAKGQSTEGFLSDLRSNSQVVDTLAQDFLKVFNGLDWVKIFSFYETMESPTAIAVSFHACAGLELADFPTRTILAELRWMGLRSTGLAKMLPSMGVTSNGKTVKSTLFR